MQACLVVYCFQLYTRASEVALGSHTRVFLLLFNISAVLSIQRTHISHHGGLSRFWAINRGSLVISGSSSGDTGHYPNFLSDQVACIWRR